MTVATAELLDRLVPPARASRGEPEWMQEERSQAKEWLVANGLPSAREEAWKYTPLDDIVAALFDATAPEPARPAIDRDLVDALAGDHGGPRLVFVNGVFAPELSGIALLPDGVVMTNGAAPVPRRSRLDGFQALNRVASLDTAVIRIAPGRDVAEPIHIAHLSVPGASSSVSHPRTLVEISPGARVTLIETYAGPAGRRLTNATTTIAVARDAEVSHYRVQTEPAGSIHVGHTRIEQASGSELRSCSLLLDGDIARNAVDVALTGRDARVEVTGLYVPTGQQRHDTVVTVEHAASGGTSRQLFKGVVDDHARGSFAGRILVQPGTVATDAGQTSRSLLLTRTAQADARPWLEIRADDVKCTHGATIGRLDADALFYLRSRGIDPHDARAMLIEAFIGEIVDAVEPPTLRSRLQATTAPRP
jgi:Fe-S cluster assembly protein SufD